MAGSFTETVLDDGLVGKRKIVWTSDSSGDVNGTALATPIIGTIERVVFQPGTGGDQPTDNYDVTLVDEDSMDVLAGIGANLANDANSQSVPVLNSVGLVSTNGDLTPTVANAGDEKSGTIIIYFRRPS